ncbi:hypothetical protein [Pararhodospirillum photometricum]|uniref:hypothetical protein n=1 Tax=Pararhodospirillum photometricum TaxID=1084 RepID=UPI00059F055E|nr:hypothetical protein [Pararhodospirillum photometricum]
MSDQAEQGSAEIGISNHGSALEITEEMREIMRKNSAALEEMMGVKVVSEGSRVRVIRGDGVDITERLCAPELRCVFSVGPTPPRLEVGVLISTEFHADVTRAFALDPETMERKEIRRLEFVDGKVVEYPFILVKRYNNTI